VNLLALDIGNTSTSLGLFRQGRLVAHDRMPTKQLPRRFRASLSSLLEAGGVSSEELDGVAIASVVPSAAKACTHFCQSNLRIQPLLITGRTPTRLKVRYRPMKSLGPDRLMAALAASHYCRPPLICASLGTATVVDAVSAEYEFLGGAVLPGVQLFVKSLAGHTALLPAIEVKEADSPIGENTESTLRAGAVFGSAAALEGLASRFRERLGKRARLVLTGGCASLVIPHLRGRFSYRPQLTLEGVWLAWHEQAGLKR
jgi:type III pantothenate kinase